MKLVTGTEMRALEERAFAAGATPEGLMATAGHAVADALHEPRWAASRRGGSSCWWAPATTAAMGWWRRGT